MDDVMGCDHDWVFQYTYADWWDGDEEDIYKCSKCGLQETRYIPR